MKFDVVVGNPPYQSEQNGDRTLNLPIYNLFMDMAYKIADEVVLITPGRFLFNAGATPKDWNRKMLTDDHLKIIYYEQDSSKVFPNTDIKGGVAVTYRNAKEKVCPINIFTPYEELNTILRKVEPKLKEIKFGEIRHLHERLDIKTLYKDYPDFENRLDVKAGRRLTSSIFTILPEIFSDEVKGEDYIKIFGRQNNKRIVKYIESRYIEKNKKLNKYKVFLPAINGSGSLGEKLSTPIIGNPREGHTQTYITLGAFDTKFEAEALLKYLKSKFFRTMLGVLKITQDNKTKEVWKYIPLQDFTPQSDIDWSKLIPEIDQQLYKKYGLNKKEINFIEEKVKAMD